MIAHFCSLTRPPFAHSSEPRRRDCGLLSSVLAPSVCLRLLHVPKAVSITLCPVLRRLESERCVRKRCSSGAPPMGVQRRRRRCTSPLITPFLMSMVRGHDSSSLSPSLRSATDHRPTVCPPSRLLLSAERLEHATSVPLGRSALVRSLRRRCRLRRRRRRRHNSHRTVLCVGCHRRR